MSIARSLALLLLMLSILGGAALSFAADCRALVDLNWLSGAWRAETADRLVMERWQPLSDGTWEGQGETWTAAGDSLLARESLRLLLMNEEIFYLAKVAHNPRPVAFRLTACERGHAVFENPDHDFPRRLDYRLDGDALRVQVSDGGDKGFTLHFVRSAGN